MLKHLYKTAFIALLGILSFQESFAQCSIKTDLNVSTISPICVGGVSTVTIVGSELNKTYEVFNGSSSISSVIMGTGANLQIPLNSLSAGTYVLTINVGSMGCTSVQLNQKPVLVVNSPPNLSLGVTSNSPICFGNAAIVTIYNSQVGVAYQAFIDGLAVSATILGTGADLSISINTLSPGIHTISFRASSPGCGSVELVDKVTIIVNSIPSYSFSVSGDVVCKENPTAKLTITGSSSTVQYQMYRGTEKFMDSFFGDLGTNTTVKNIPTSLLLTGKNLIKVEGIVNTSCQTLVMADNAEIIVNATPDFPAPILDGDTVLVTDKFATITIDQISGGLMILIKGPLQDTAFVSSGKLMELKIPVGAPNGLAIGTHKVSFHTQIVGCVNKDINDSAWVVVKPELTTSIEDKLSTTNFAVYPNPFSSEITITSKLKGQLKMQITDAIGNIVHQESISNPEALKLNPDLKSGLYFLQMESEGLRETVKLIKQ